MDKIQKALKKLTPKEREIIKNLLAELEMGNMRGLDVKRLKGFEDIFRVRRGGLRIIYHKGKKNIIFVLRIDRKNESTYKF